MTSQGHFVLVPVDEGIEALLMIGESNIPKSRLNELVVSGRKVKVDAIQEVFHHPVRLCSDYWGVEWDVGKSSFYSCGTDGSWRGWVVIILDIEQLE